MENITKGAFLHDVAKYLNLEKIMNNQQSADITSTRDIVYKSYYMLSKSHQSPSIVYTAAFHQEYYGEGVGIYNDIHKRMLEKSPHFSSSNIISYDVHDVLSLSARTVWKPSIETLSSGMSWCSHVSVKHIRLHSRYSV